MRILVLGDALAGPASRMALAAAGLALRGHRVSWRGPGVPAFQGAPPAELEPVRGGVARARTQADVVLAGPARVLAAASAGWLAHARCMVLALEAPALRAWRRRDRWAWSTLHASGLIEEGEAGAVSADPHGLDLERVALWSPGTPPDAPDAAHLDTEILERACERSLARHRTRSPRPAVFVDRDGTLVVERGYLSDPADLELLPRAVTALRRLAAAGFPVVVVSNQSGVERGLFPASRVHAAMARLRSLLRVHGIELDAIYFCPHRPEAGCACRKPGTALLERAADDLVLSLARSFMVGDKLLDVETAHNARARGVLVRTGYGRDEERRLAGGEGAPAPDRVCEDLEEAARWILGREEPGEA